MKNQMMNPLKNKSLAMMVLMSVLFIAGESFAFAQGQGGQGQGQGQGQRQGQSGQRQGQGQRNPGEAFERTYQFLVDSVQINENQQKKVKEINSRYQQKMTELREQMQNTDNREAAREKFRSTMQEYDKEIVAVLTDAQKKKYEKAKQQRQKQMEQRQGERPQGEQPQSRGNRGQRGGN